MNEEYQNQQHSETIDFEAQRAARDAVMKIELFPDLFVMLRKALGYGPHVEMMQHFVFWFHPRHPKMQNRWTQYRTFAEWHEKCGLSDRQVKKGRETLREAGLLTWKRGMHSKPHYRVDWIALAKLLMSDTVGGRHEVGHQGGQLKSDTVGGRLNTEKNVSKELTENSLLQRGGNGAFSSAAPPQLNGKEKEKEQVVASPNGDKRHPRVRQTQQPTLAAEVKHKVSRQIFGYPKPTTITALADKCIDGETDAYEVAEAVRRVVGGKEPIKAYLPWVKRCLKEKKADREIQEA